MSDNGFYEWWQQHYSMANLAMGAAEDAWNAATERAAKIAEAMPSIREISPDHVQATRPSDIAAAIRSESLSSEAIVRKMRDEWR